MPPVPPAASEPEPGDPIGLRFPNTARVWNYHLRGKDNFAVDRQAAEAVEAMSVKIGVPLAADTAVEGRHLLQRMVDYMLGQGIRQFLDLGSGLPSMANTHQIAHRVAPEARVVYIDIDPMVSSHASARMAGSNVVTLRADLREPEQVLGDPQVRELLDFGQPIGVMFACVLHCLWDSEDPWAVVRQFGDAVPSGSYLALSHMTNETHPEGAQALFQMTQDLHWNTPLISRAAGGHPAPVRRVHAGGAGPGAAARWRPDLDNPLVGPHEDDGDDAPVLRLVVPERPLDDGAAWHLCGIGVKP